MSRSIAFAIVLCISASAEAGDLKVSTLEVPAEKIGKDWTGPTGLVVDDIDAPPASSKELAEIVAGLAKQMKPLGVKGVGDFTYRKPNQLLPQVTVRVFVFGTEDQCKQWMKTKYQFDGWEKKYKRVETKEYAGLDSLEMKKRIIASGNVWITSGTIADSNDHLKVLDLVIANLTQARKDMEPSSKGATPDGTP